MSCHSEIAPTIDLVRVRKDQWWGMERSGFEVHASLTSSGLREGCGREGIGLFGEPWFNQEE